MQHIHCIYNSDTMFMLFIKTCARKSCEIYMYDVSRVDVSTLCKNHGA